VYAKSEVTVESFIFCIPGCHLFIELLLYHLRDVFFSFILKKTIAFAVQLLVRYGLVLSKGVWKSVEMLMCICLFEAHCNNQNGGKVLRTKEMKGA